MAVEIFIAGTDTGIGKTHVATSLVKSLSQEGYRTVGIKPIASGCVRQDNGELHNEDALALQAASSLQLPYAQINPFAFEPAIAPHIAADMAGEPLTVACLKAHLKQLHQHQADIHIIEGVGGWLVPLNAQETMADLVAELQLPTILVVGIRLGCLNHTLLTIESMMQANIPLLGWVANCIDPAAAVIDDNIATLVQRISAPLLCRLEMPI